jgi:hypothetical protein
LVHLCVHLSAYLADCQLTFPLGSRYGFVVGPLSPEPGAVSHKCLWRHTLASVLSDQEITCDDDCTESETSTSRNLDEGKPGHSAVSFPIVLDDVDESSDEEVRLMSLNAPKVVE